MNLFSYTYTYKQGYFKTNWEAVLNGLKDGKKKREKGKKKEEKRKKGRKIKVQWSKKMEKGSKKM